MDQGKTDLCRDIRGLVYSFLKPSFFQGEKRSGSSGGQGLNREINIAFLTGEDLVFKFPVVGKLKSKNQGQGEGHEKDCYYGNRGTVGSTHFQILALA